MRSAAGLAAAVATLAFAPVAGAAVTVGVGGKECYAEGDEIQVEGSGYSPNGNVRLTLERAAGGEVLETTDDPTANDAGAISGGYRVNDETGWFDSTQSRFEMVLRAVDLTRLNQGRPQDDPEVGATASFIFSRWAIGVLTVGGTIHPRRRVALNPVGYTNAVGKPLYAHWMRGSKRVFTKRLGTLRGPCGDLRRTLSRGFPFRPVLPGRYTVRFSPSRTNTRNSAISIRAARVKRTIR